MRKRNVVVLAYPGVQSLDVVGPYEVFAGATRVAAAAGSAGYTVRLVSAGGGAVTAGSGIVLGAGPLPGPEERIDTLVLPGGDQARRGMRRCHRDGMGGRHRPPLPTGGHRLHGGLHRRRGRSVGRPAGDHALGLGRPTGP